MDSKTRKEAEIITSIISKIGKNFPRMLSEALEEFKEFFGEDVASDGHFGQYFYGWFLSLFSISDGKDMVCLARECLDLSEEEKKILENIHNRIPGYFRILNINAKNFLLEDALTKKQYEVVTIDLDNAPKSGEIIEANLVKNLEGNYFFFGGLRKTDNSRVAKLNMEENSRDLTVEELVEREMLIISPMIEDGSPVGDYLIETLDFELNEIPIFLKGNDKKREEMIKNKIVFMISRENDEI